MSAHFAKCSYLSQKYFRLLPESWSFVSFGSPSLSSSSLLTRLRTSGPQNYALQVLFHAVYRRKTYAEIPLPPKFIFKDSLAPTKDATFGQKFRWPPTFSKKSSRIDRSQLLLDGRFGPKFHLAQTFLRRVSHPFPFFAVHYSSLQFVTAQRMLGDLRWHFVFHCPHRVLTLIQTTIRTLRCVVNNDKVCETQHPRVCAFAA